MPDEVYIAYSHIYYFFTKYHLFICVREEKLTFQEFLVVFINFFQDL